MSVEEVLSELRRRIQSRLPPDINVTGLEFEGPELVIYTDDPRRLADDGEIIRSLAKDLRKRVVVRPDLKVLMDPEEAIKKIQEVVPKEAVLTNYHFDGETGEVIIEAEKPGLVIGRHGATLREITKLIGWTPKVVRTPPVRSSTIANIKDYLRSVQTERKSILRSIGRKIHRDIASKDQWVRISTLGGCREVGRSCMLLSTPESKIIVDCGINVGSDDSATPYLYVPEVYPLSQIDAVVLTHAHLDHSGLVPMLYKYGYEGPIYCTPPTRDLYVLLQLDYIEVAGREGKRLPYDSSMIREALKHTITLNYGDVTDIAPDTKLTMHNAGHILGSAIAHFHIGDGLYNVAFTGDFKYEKTRLFDPAVNSFPRLETLVIEATYGGANSIQPSRKEAENHLLRVVRETIKRGGKVVIPAFAVGRSQEVMVVLEEAIRKGLIGEFPVYLDGMIYEATAIHTSYPEYLNNELRDMIFHKGINPFLAECFVQVENSKQRDEIINGEPAVILATSGMLNGGPIMEYLKGLGPDEKNTLVIVGYQAEGTLGRRIQKGWKEIPLTVEGKTQTVKMNMEVVTVDGFSGHSDRNQLMEYVRRVYPKPSRIITNHGDESNCLDLASSIYKKYRIPTSAPMNLETIRLI
ncbi:MAG: beta-CASP ribonuclease aCPSF1 [Methanothrix sp.]|uniref:Transcription termination factor FttA n=1 Tax=Methanothrix thermoacetophila (strain DSM 6194 / JCM 14653 / NBRC 101360 / PT) TaxID=349307 RepID=A0B5B0_METTP|nr:beta-CASP ribonuclease aCPSF1 [Methanothrix thermoacetophila]ABK13884.1 beta-lactamase domain protein [Methanothrix thermoacetophila PT]MBC7079941.1 beta-CASP ribonuclease aCPSF1 [Methanothrix sp.]NPU88091.1 beta-CASP ribonuclease aCPSF1 [Methanothrix sp.]